MGRKRRAVRRPSVDRLEERCLLSGASLPPGLSPSGLVQAYGLGNVTFRVNGQAVQANGAGQTIAVVVAYHDPYLASDLHTFDSAYGLPDPSLSQTNLAGSATNDGWAGEETLDVEWAHALAPGASIVVVEAASDDVNSLLAAVNVARFTPGVVAVSMSWGTAEMANEAQFDAYFTTPSGHAGITFVAASGDGGARAGAQWPASSPNVLAVGGTTLYIGAGGTYAAETAWSGSGGGLSRYEPEPAYQLAVQRTGRRSTPDVSFVADPNTGVAVFTTNPSTGQGSWAVVGGTSLGSPGWAAVIAIVDQGLALNGAPSLNGATQTLPLLYALPGSDFNTPVNVTTGRLFGRYGQSEATTGLGSPDGAALITAIVSSKGGVVSDPANIGETTPGTPAGTTPTATTPTGATPAGGQTAPTLPPGGQPKGGEKGSRPNGGKLPAWFNTWWWEFFSGRLGTKKADAPAGGSGLASTGSGQIPNGPSMAASPRGRLDLPLDLLTTPSYPLTLAATPAVPTDAWGRPDAFGLRASVAPASPTTPTPWQNAPAVLVAIEEILRERSTLFEVA